MGQFTGAEDEVPEPETGPSIADEINEIVNPTPEPEPEPEPQVETPPPTNLEEYIEIAGQRIPKSMEQSVAELVNWAASMTPEQEQAVWEAYQRSINGEPQPSVQQQTAPEPEPEPAYEDLDEDTAKVMREMADRQRRLEEELAAERERLQSIEGATAEQVYRQQYEQGMQVEERIKGEFLAQHGLDEDDYLALTKTSGELGIAGPMVQKFGLEEGLRRTLDAALYANEDVRSKTVEKPVREELTQQANQERKEAQSALNPQGGTSIPDQNPASLPEDEKRAAMKRDIAEMLGMN